MRDLGSPSDTVAGGLRRLRVLAAAAVFLQVVARKPVAPNFLGMSPVVLGIVIAAVLVAVNALTLASAKARTPMGARAFEAAELAADAAVAVAVVAGLGAIDENIAWALLVVPVLEGALKYRLTGAVLTWAAVAATYLAIELVPLGGPGSLAHQVAFIGRLQELVPRMGIVLLLAVPGGYLADQLVRAIAAQRRAKFDATTRGGLLEMVVNAGRRITQLGGSLEDDVAACARELGFAGADLCERESRSGCWRVGSPSLVPLPDPDSAAGAAHFAVSRQSTVIVEVDGSDPEVDDVLTELSWSAVIATPIRGDDREVVLRVGLRPLQTLSVHQIECLELLAGHVSVALRNTRLVRELHHAQEQLEHQAFHDALTELPNREYFYRRLDEVLTAGPCPAVLFLDLDSFKEVNDGLGHDVGDELLRVASRRLRHCARTDSTIARIGGDEFAILLPHATDEEAAIAVADRVCDALTEPFKLAGHEVVVSSSIGIALGDPDCESSGELMRRADVAMYQAKSRGAASWRIWSPDMEGAALERMQLDTELRGAFERGELGVAYQPIANAETNRIIGVEALLRWPSSHGIEPDIFIPLAEDSGFIVELGHWILGEACKQLGAWRKRFPDLVLSMSVNVSPRELVRPGFMQGLEKMLESTGTPAESLVLEMTERVFAGEDAPALLAAIRALGVRVAIDDFGQGQASMSYLTRFQVDILKIDKAFVQRTSGRDKNRAIVKSMIGLAHDLGIKVVAEGVESAAHLAHLKRLKCDAIQGYFFSPPMSAEDIGEVLATEVDELSGRRVRRSPSRRAS